MIPAEASSCWRALATGKKPLHTEFLGLQLILKRVQRRLGPASTDQEIQAAATEIHAFFLRYQSVLGKEIESL